MSFCVTHRSALDKNLRHLYSGQSRPLGLRTSAKSLDGSLDIMDRVYQQLKRPPERFESKFQEYVPEYSARLPRAPAFRSVSPEVARLISQRLSRPTFMSAVRHKSAVSRGATKRSESRKSARSEHSFYSKSEHHSTLDTSDGRNRKVSYQDWSDEDDSGHYYYIDEESSVVESSGRTNTHKSEKFESDRHKHDKDSGTHVIDFNATPVTQNRAVRKSRYDTKRSRDTSSEVSSPSSPDVSRNQANSEHHKTEAVRVLNRNTDSRSRSSSSSSFNESDYRKESVDRPDRDNDSNNDDIKRANVSSTSSIANASTENTSGNGRPKFIGKAGSHSKKKMSLLEQIMQPRSAHGGRRSHKPRKVSGVSSSSAVSHTTDSYSNKSTISDKDAVNRRNVHNTKGASVVQKRERLDARLTLSPYREPTPQLYIVYTPVKPTKRTTVPSKVNRNSQPGPWSSPNGQAPQKIPTRARTAHPHGRDVFVRQEDKMKRPQTQQGRNARPWAYDMGFRYPSATNANKSTPKKQKSATGAKQNSAISTSPDRDKAENKFPMGKSHKYNEHQNQEKQRLEEQPGNINRQLSNSISDSDDSTHSSCSNGSKKINKQAEHNQVKRLHDKDQYDSNRPKEPNNNNSQAFHSGTNENHSVSINNISHISHDGSMGVQDSSAATRTREPYNHSSQNTKQTAQEFSLSPVNKKIFAKDSRTRQADDFHPEGESSRDMHASLTSSGEAALYHPGRQNRRFISPEEQDRSNKRLQKPTKVNVIRDRMRWARNNDTDLADPVRVIREVTGNEREGERWMRRKGDDSRGGLSDQTGEIRNHSMSSSEDDEEYNMEMDRARYKPFPRDHRDRELTKKRKREEWIKRGVIQSRKIVMQSTPMHQNNMSKTVQRKQKQKDSPMQKGKVKTTRNQDLNVTNADDARRAPKAKKESQDGQKQSYPRPHPNSSSRPAFPRSRSSSASRSPPSTPNSARSESTLKRSRSGSSSQSRSRSASRSKSRSRSVSRSRSRSKSPPRSRSRSKSPHSPRSISPSRSKSRSRSSSSGSNHTTSTTQKSGGHVTNKTKKDSSKIDSSKDHIESGEKETNAVYKEDNEEHLRGKKNYHATMTTERDQQDNTITDSFLHQTEDSEMNDRKIQGIVRDYEIEAANRASGESPEAGRISGASYTTDRDDRADRGDESIDRFGRGDEGNQKVPIVESKVGESSNDVSQYTHNRRTRGRSEEYSSDEAKEVDERRVSFVDPIVAVGYSVHDESKTRNVSGNTSLSRSGMASDPVTEKPEANNSVLEDFLRTETHVKDSFHREDEQIKSSKNILSDEPDERVYQINNESDFDNDRAELNVDTAPIHPGTVIHDTNNPAQMVYNSSDTTHESNPAPFQFPEATTVLETHGYSRLTSQERQDFDPVDLDGAWRGDE